MTTLEHILLQFGLDESQKSPLLIPGGRQRLAELFAELGFTSGAEIGVEQGKFSKVFCEANPDAKLYAIDAWAAYKGYREHVSQEKLDGFEEATRKLLKPYNCVVVKGFSVEVAAGFPDNSLDFVYLDGNHDFINIAQDIHAWHKKVRRGGIVSGHDFRRGDSKWPCAVKDVVQAWTYSQGIKPWFVVTGDRSPSWFYVV